MEAVREYVVWACLLGGAFFSVVGGIGLLRLPDFYTRIHAGGVTDTMGVGLLTLGMVIHVGPTLLAAKLLFIMGFLWLGSATVAHALTKAALANGLKPLLVDDLTADPTPDRGASVEGESSKP